MASSNIYSAHRRGKFKCNSAYRLSEFTYTMVGKSRIKFVSMRTTEFILVLLYIY